MSRTAPRASGRLPADKQRTMARARRHEQLTLLLRVTVIAALYATLDDSAALNAIWLKSLWALLPPIAFLVATRVETLQPTPRFPYGFFRASSIAFLTAGLTLTTMGLFLLYSGARELAAMRHPELAAIWAHGSLWHWAGWPILAAVAWSMIVPLIAGRARGRLAVELHDKGLYADATMGLVDWRAGGAAALGIIGLGTGFWWADAMATLLIAADIVWLGTGHLYTALSDLIDEVPRRIDSHELEPLGADIQRRLEALEWIGQARVRLREQGRMFTGVGLLRIRDGGREDEPDLVARLDAARAQIVASDWRLLDFQLVPVGSQRWQSDSRQP